MWMRAKNGSSVNMSMMECLSINGKDRRQIVAISPSGKTYLMAECATTEDAVMLLNEAAKVMNRAMGTKEK